MATRPIDEKIIAMKMDNSDFVKKASETTSLMGKFTNALNKIPGVNLGKTTSEFQNIQRSVNGIDASRLSSAVDAVTSRFSTMGIVATTALVNITNRAVDAGLSMMRHLTVGPILDGFREYETKIGSIQTILANTSKFGTDVDDVTNALGDLNTYADKTIYNFGQMTKNIGLFTNAGLGLEESTSMIKGFANAAAASGSNAEQMAGAAYQLSQGLASGFIITQDWMSLTNAGMGNDNMKRDLIALGHAMGTLKTSTEGTIKNWKESLTDDRWLTKEVFSTYLQAMAGDLDKAKLKTIGLTEAQADLLLQNAKTGEEAATKVRTFTQMVGTLVESIGSGWSETFEIIFGDFDHATKLWSGFSELISAPFSKMTESRNKLAQTLKDQGVFEEIFVTLGSAIYVVGQAIGAVSDGFNKAFSSDRVNVITKLVSGFKSFVSAMTPSQATLGNISTIFQAVGSNVRVVMKVLGEVGKVFLNLIPDGLGTKLLAMLAGFAKMNIAFNESILNGKGFKSSFEGIGSVFSWIGDRIGDVVGALAVFGKTIFEIFTTLATGQSVTDGMFDKNSTIVIWLTAIHDAAKSVIERIKDIKISLAPVSEAFGAFFSAIRTGFNWMKEKLSGIGKTISESMPSGTTLFAGGFIAALGAISALVLKRVNDISKIFGGWGKTVQGFGDTLDSVSGALDSFSLSIKANALLTAALAVGVLAGAIFLLSKVDGTTIGTSLTAIVGSLSAVIGALSIMNKYDITGGLKTTASIIGIAVALSVMSIALRAFGSMRPEELTKGLIGVVTILAALAGAFALMGKFNQKDIAVSAVQIVAMSVAVMLLAQSVKTLSDLNPGELVKGIGSLAAIMVALASALSLMGKFGAKGAASALQLVAIAGSVILLVAAIKMISTIDVPNLLIGLATITAILAAVAAFSAVTSGTGLLGSAVGLLAISVAMNALIVPIFALGHFPIDKLIIGLTGMSVALLAIASASKLMGGSLAGVAGILGMAVALNLLLVPIGVFAAMGWGPMLVGVAGLALSLGALAGVSLLLAPATLPLLGFSAAIGLMGLAMLAAGAGMTLFSTGLVALAGMSAAAVTTILATLGALIAGMISLAPKAAEFVLTIATQILQAIRRHAPKIISIVAETIITLIKTIASYVPEFASAAVKLLTSFIDAIATEAPKIIESAANLLITLVETMAATVETYGPRFTNAFLELFGTILTIMVKSGAAVVKGLFGWIPGVNKAMNAVAKTAEKSIDEALDTAKLSEEKADDFSKGLGSKSEDVKTSASSLSTSATEGLESGNSWNSGDLFASQFISGILARKGDAASASSQLAGAAQQGTNDTLGIHSPSTVGIAQGQYYGEGVAIGIDNSADTVKQSVNNMTKGISSGGITDMIRDKLFISDDDVSETEKNTAKIGESYDDASKYADKSSKSKTKSEKDHAKSAEDIRRDQFQKDKEWIDDRKYYHKLSLDEELAAWQRIQKKYAAGTEERKQADREVFRVQQEITKAKEDAEKEAFNKSKEYIDERKYYNQLSLEEELASWQRIQSKTKQGTEERKQADREVYRINKELIKEKEDAEKKAFNSSKSWMDERKYYGKLTLDEELAGWQRMQKRYKEGTEERKEADREVFRLKQELIRAAEDADRDSINASKSWMDERKYYGQLTLEEELAGWERVQKRFKEGTDERKEADREVYRVKNEIRNRDFENEKKFLADKKYYNQITLEGELDFWKDIQAKYAEGTQERIEADREVYRIESELRNKAFEDEKKQISDRKYYNELSLADELKSWMTIQAKYKEGTQERMEADREVYRVKNEINQKLLSIDKEYTAKVSELNQKLIDGEKALNEQYAKSVDDRTSALVGFSGLFDAVPEKAKVAGKTLIDNLKGQVDTFSTWADNIKKLSNRGLDKGLIGELEKMGPQAANEISALTTMTDEELTEYAGLWLTKNQLARQEATRELETLKADTSAKIDELRIQTSKDLDAVKTEWLTKIEEISKGTSEQFVSLQTDMQTVGSDAIKGMIAGMDSMAPSLATKTREIADSVTKSIKNTLRIKSPSRVLMALGEYATEGLAVGMDNESGQVLSSAKKLATTAKDALNKFLKGFELPESDNELRFKAVIEYDKLDTSRFGLSNLLVKPDTSFTTNTMSEVRAANRQNGDTSRRVETSTPTEVSKSTVINQNLTFNSRELTPSEVARKNRQASRQLAINWGM